jgi:hypothetical protein
MNQNVDGHHSSLKLIVILKHNYLLQVGAWYRFFHVLLLLREEYTKIMWLTFGAVPQF